MFSITLGYIVFFCVALAWMIYLSQEIFISGVSLLNLSIAKNDKERQEIQTISGLHKDGMEVWLLAAVVLTEGGFPGAFGKIFSSLYVVMFLLLFAVIARGLTVELMYKHESKVWQKWMSIVWTISSIALVFLLGVYITNTFLGLSYGANGVEGSIFSVLNVTGISGGMFFVALSFLSGAAWINLLTEGDLKDRAMRFVKKVGVMYSVPVFFFLAVMGFNNTHSSIWAGQLFSAYPVLYILPFLVFVGTILIIYYGYKQKAKPLLITTMAVSSLYVLTGFIGMFPYVLNSKINTDFGITIEQAMSSKTALTIALVAVVIFFPLVLGYQTWKYKKFWKKETE